MSTRLAGESAGGCRHRGAVAAQPARQPAQVPDRLGQRRVHTTGMPVQQRPAREAARRDLAGLLQTKAKRAIAFNRDDVKGQLIGTVITDGGFRKVGQHHITGLALMIDIVVVELPGRGFGVGRVGEVVRQGEGVGVEEKAEGQDDDEVKKTANKG